MFYFLPLELGAMSESQGKDRWIPDGEDIARATDDVNTLV
jgi:hypothetical protein